MSMHQLLAAGPHTLTTDRLVATLAVLVWVAGAIAGGLALARPSLRRSAVALAAGVIGTVTGAIVVATADGGPGTGNGVVGGWAALAIGLVALVLGGVATSRARRLGSPG